MKYITSILLILLSNLYCGAQFAPQAGLAGSTAIHKDSSIVIAWADSCEIWRGWIDKADTTLGNVTLGNKYEALNKADGFIVSLGDGGEAVYYFSNPIINGSGYDFAIYENGFINPTDSNMAFLELAEISVSNDGNNYYKFSTVCNNDTTIQIAGAGDYMDARKINNLAGKYVVNYGTPFDLNELSVIPTLDVNNIHFIKVKDVTGSINDTLCTRDNNYQKINDPYPTPYPSGGFDLDALGIIHQKYPTNMNSFDIENEISIYPNPCTQALFIKNCSSYKNICLYTYDGRLILKNICKEKIDVTGISKGLYYLELEKKNGSKSIVKIVKE